LPTGAVGGSPESFVNAPAATIVAHEPAGKAQTIFSGGCYWGVEGVFSHVNGVTSAVSGFHAARPIPPSTSASRKAIPAMPIGADNV